MDKKISITKNGPYVVSGSIPISDQIIGTDKEGNSETWKEGKKYPCLQSCALCRCGHSQDKPYCSGMHAKIGFDGKENSKNKSFEKEAEITKGKNLVLKDVPSLCASARFCDPDSGTWQLTKDSANSEKKKKAIMQACNCPSGRLVACENGKNIEPKFEKSIGVVEDPESGVSGPLWVRGGIEIESSTGKKYEIRNRVTLCRCGLSKNKPFCDGTHMTAGFSSEE